MEILKTFLAYDKATLSVIMAILSKPDKVKISSSEGQFSLIYSASERYKVNNTMKPTSAMTEDEISQISSVFGTI